MELALLLALSFFLRIPFVLGASSDTFIHQWLIQKSVKNRFGKHTAYNSFVTGDFPYPSLPHYIVSLMPQRHWLLSAHILNIVYDCLNVAVFYFLAKFLFTNTWPISIDNTDQLSFHFLAALIYTTSPILFPVNARLKSIGGRTFGGLLVLLYFVCLGAAWLYQIYWLYFLVWLIGLVILMSSQFAAQAMTFFSLILSVLWGSILPASMVLLIIVLGYLIKPIGIHRIIVGKINHYIWYFRNYTGHPQVGSRNHLKDIIRLPYYLFASPRYFLELGFTRITPIIAIFNLPLLWPVLYYIIQGEFEWNLLAQDQVLDFLWFLVLASFFVFAITSIKWFLFLGQAERYFEYSIAPLTLLFVYWITFADIPVSVGFYVIILNLIVVLINFIWVVKSQLKWSVSDNLDLEFKELMEFLQAQKNLKILFIPTKLNYLLDAYLGRQDFKYYLFFISSQNIEGFKYMEQDEVSYGYLIPDLSSLSRKYGADTLVVKKSDLGTAQDMGINYDFNGLILAYENAQYRVYNFENMTAGSLSNEESS